MDKVKKVKVGIVGCGAIGTTLSEILNEKFKDRFDIVAFCDLAVSKAEGLKEKVGCGRVVGLSELIELSDLVVEAASAGTSFDIARQALENNRDVLIMSMGGLLGKERELFEIAEENKSKVYLPSGAICGLDGVKALKVANIEEVTLKTYKPPEALKGADYLLKKGIDLDAFKSEKIIFEGTAKEAVAAFPKNINVVALLGIAAGGQVVPRVKIYVCPDLKRNVHVIEVKSGAGNLTIKCENMPSPYNPKTSFMAILSAVATIAGISKSVKIGN